jgi:hypothetical protein
LGEKTETFLHNIDHGCQDIQDTFMCSFGFVKIQRKDMLGKGLDRE